MAGAVGDKRACRIRPLVRRPRPDEYEHDWGLGRRSLAWQDRGDTHQPALLILLRRQCQLIALQLRFTHRLNLVRRRGESGGIGQASPNLLARDASLVGGGLCGNLLGDLPLN
jgi:hypothetical protein